MDGDLDAIFLHHLPLQCLHQCFPELDTATRNFPPPPFVLCRRSAQREENLSRVIEDCRPYPDANEVDTAHGLPPDPLPEGRGDLSRTLLLLASVCQCPGRRCYVPLPFR